MSDGILVVGMGRFIYISENTAFILKRRFVFIQTRTPKYCHKIFFLAEFIYQTGKMVVGCDYAKAVDLFHGMKNIYSIYCHGKICSVPAVSIIADKFDPVVVDAFSPVGQLFTIAIDATYDHPALAGSLGKHAPRVCRIDKIPINQHGKLVGVRFHEMIGRNRQYDVFQHQVPDVQDIAYISWQARYELMEREHL